MSDYVDLMRKWLSHDAPPLVQFAKYVCVGAVATAVNFVVAEACAATIIPCLSGNDVLVRHLGLTPADVAESVRAMRAIYCNVIGFVVANLLCWLLNRAFVFRPGRHRWPVELALFFGGSAVSVMIGSGVIGVLIWLRGVQTTWAFIANIVTSVLVNYAVRKFVVFKG